MPRPIRCPLRSAPGCGWAREAVLHWLPQETILFDRCALDRRLRIEMPASARFLGVETLVFGRTAMGERLASGRLTDRWDLFRDGRRVFADALRLDGDLPARLASPFGAAGCGALATVVYAAPDAAAHLADLRAGLPALSGLSCPTDGVLLARLLATDSYALRAQLVPLLERLARAPIPKVWRL